MDEGRRRFFNNKKNLPAIFELRNNFEYFDNPLIYQNLYEIPESVLDQFLDYNKLFQQMSIV